VYFHLIDRTIII